MQNEWLLEFAPQEIKDFAKQLDRHLGSKADAADAVFPGQSTDSLVEAAKQYGFVRRRDTSVRADVCRFILLRQDVYDALRLLYVGDVSL